MRYKYTCKVNEAIACDIKCQSRALDMSDMFMMIQGYIIHAMPVPPKLHVHKMVVNGKVQQSLDVVYEMVH